MKKFEIDIPLHRARKKNSNEYIIGYLIGIDKENNLCAVRQLNEEYVGVDICNLSTLSISFPDMTDSQGNKIFASLREDGRGGDIFEHSVNCRLDSPRPHDGTYWISCKSPLVYKDFGFYFKYHIIDSTPKYADGKITNRKGLARFEKNLKVIGIQD